MNNQKAILGISEERVSEVKIIGTEEINMKIDKFGFEELNHKQNSSFFTRPVHNDAQEWFKNFFNIEAKNTSVS